MCALINPLLNLLCCLSHQSYMICFVQMKKALLALKHLVDLGISAPHAFYAQGFTPLSYAPDVVMSLYSFIPTLMKCILRS